MTDTRETIYADANLGPFGRCRFQRWDVIISASALDVPIVNNSEPEWIPERGGWCLISDNTYVHESHFIVANEAINYRPHKTYWTLKKFKIGNQEFDL
jgi:hypothetical protein